MRPIFDEKVSFFLKILEKSKMMGKTKKIISLLKNGQNHNVIHHLEVLFSKFQKYHHFTLKSLKFSLRTGHNLTFSLRTGHNLRNQNTVTKQMKNKPALKVTGKQ